MDVDYNFLILFGFLAAGVPVCQVGGAFIYNTVARSLSLPWFGPFLSFLLNKPTHLIGVVKLFSWVVSSSGLVVSYYAYTRIFRVPSTRSEFWAMFIVAIFSLTRIASHLVMFNLVPFREAFRMSSNSLSAEQLVIIDNKLQHKLAVQNFIAFYLTQFFRLLVASGFVYYCLGKLDLVIVILQPTLFESIGMAFSLINLTAESAKSYAGVVWVIVRTINTFLVFYWTVLFISLAASSINPDDFDPKGVGSMEKNETD